MTCTRVFARRIAGVVLTLVLAGCKTWQPVTVGPERLIAEQQPARVRVTTQGGAQMTLRDPIFVNDSIVSPLSRAGTAFTVPRAGTDAADVRSIEVAKFSATRTLVLGVAIIAGALTWARVASGNSGGANVPDDPLPKDPLLARIGGIRISFGPGW